MLPLLLAAAIGAALVWPISVSLRSQPPVESRPIAPRGDLADFERTAVELFQAASPSVVYINTRARVANRWTRRVYEVEAGTGSGFVWDELGHVITNYHVVASASSAEVVFFDHSSFEADLVGASPDHDLAVLRVRAPRERLSPVVVGESDNLAVGQAVFAIGNPFGLTHTLTTGVVSASSRSIRGPSGRSIEDVIQIDAAINPGNSGGPLLDSAARLIGVNTAIYSPSGASAGVGFAVPVGTVNRVVPQLIARGEYRPPRLGIRTTEEVNAFVRQRHAIAGVVVLQVEPGSGADRAGLRGASIDRDGSLRLGDVIQAVDGRRVASLNELLSALERRRVGDSVSLEVLGDGRVRTLEVVLE